MKRLFFLSLLLAPLLSFGQVSISGEINQYTAVVNVDSCTASLLVADASLFQTGQQLLILQMQGATIDESDSAAFGTISDIGQAGKFEQNEIDSINGNILFLKNTLLHAYDPAGQVQVVSFPTYTSALVTDTLLAADWNGVTGGVLALQVTDTLFLQAPLMADSRGFRGGQVNILSNNCQWFFNENNYFYSINNWRGAPKGEGIAAIIAGKEQGRGPQANGGGGGNDHNSGGGGGSNTVSGGQGGKQTPPSVFSCGGDFPGLGGKPLTFSDERIFLGGGGGAGHANNAGTGSAGGNGGGIIILQASTIIANEQWISANGAHAQEAPGDGAGGGGGGGTVLLFGETISGILNVSLLGGRGADTQNLPDRCYGPGGGGSGGKWLSNLTPTGLLQLDGGQPGLNLNPTSACATAANEAAPGQNGQTGTLPNIPGSNQTYTALNIIQGPPAQVAGCTGDSVAISIQASGPSPQYQWQVDSGSGFENLNDSSPYSGSQTATLIIQPLDAGQNGYLYRCLISNTCFEPIPSTTAQLTVEEAPLPSFSFSENGSLSLQFENLTTNATVFNWDFGDGSFSDTANPQHTYSEEGTYIVSLMAGNACGQATFSDTISVFQKPNAAFNWDFDGGCSPHTVQFTDQTQGNVDSLRWLFPGGDPDTSSDVQPVVSYFQAGFYDVSLIAYNGNASDTLTYLQLIEVLDPPTTEIGYTVSNDTFYFTQTTTGGPNLNYEWNFGDGSDPVFGPTANHIYTGPGPYEVILKVSNLFCGTVDQVIVTPVSTLETREAKANFTLSPNPTSGELRLGFPKNAEGVIWLVDANGRILNSWILSAGTEQLDIQIRATAGPYWLIWKNGSRLYSLPLILE